MKEKNITPAILKSMRDDERFSSCLVEIKISKTKTLNKDALKDHQRIALELATFEEMYFKIPDSGYQNPCDAFIMKQEQSYLVIAYKIPKTSQSKAISEVWALKIQDVPIGESISLDYCRKKGIRVNL